MGIERGKDLAAMYGDSINHLKKKKEPITEGGMKEYGYYLKTGDATDRVKNALGLNNKKQPKSKTEESDLDKRIEELKRKSKPKRRSISY
jgi:hypothetical protein